MKKVAATGTMATKGSMPQVANSITAEYIAMVTVSVLGVIMFMGGWNPPLDPEMFGMEFPSQIMALAGIFWFVVKTAAFIYFFMWVRFTLPRYRYDQLMTIGWKILIPVALVNILVTGLMRIFLS